MYAGVLCKLHVLGNLGGLELWLWWTGDLGALQAGASLVGYMALPEQAEAVPGSLPRVPWQDSRSWSGCRRGQSWAPPHKGQRSTEAEVGARQGSRHRVWSAVCKGCSEHWPGLLSRWWGAEIVMPFSPSKPGRVPAASSPLPPLQFGRLLGLVSLYSRCPFLSGARCSSYCSSPRQLPALRWASLPYRVWLSCPSLWGLCSVCRSCSVAAVLLQGEMLCKSV